MSTEITDKQLAWFDYRKEYGSWPEPELSRAHKHFCAGYDAALKDAA